MQKKEESHHLESSTSAWLMDPFGVVGFVQLIFFYGVLLYVL
jgi:hypothetical protein